MLTPNSIFFSNFGVSKFDELSSSTYCYQTPNLYHADLTLSLFFVRLERAFLCSRDSLIFDRLQYLTIFS